MDIADAVRESVDVIDCDYDVPRETFGRVALNMRANAARNPKAAMKAPLTVVDLSRCAHDPSLASAGCPIV